MGHRRNGSLLSMRDDDDDDERDIDYCRTLDVAVSYNF